MAVQTKAYLKTLFEKGDRPTAQDFIDLIDSLMHVDGGDLPDPLPAISAENLSNIPIPDPLPAVSGEQLTGITPTEWEDAPAPVSKMDDTHFVLADDRTAIYLVGRAVKIDRNGADPYYSHVVGATYDGGSGYTIVETEDAVPSDILSAGYYSFIKPVDQGGSVRHSMVGAASAAELAAHAASGGAAHPAATTGSAGFLSAADKQTLDDTAAGLLAHDGEGGATHPAATGAVAGFMSAADKARLDGAKLLKAGMPLVVDPYTTGAHSVAHGLGAGEHHVRGELICKTAEKGYSVGDKVPYSPDATVDGNSLSHSINDTTLTCYIGGTPKLWDKATNNNTLISAANWKLVLTPYLEI